MFRCCFLLTTVSYLKFSAAVADTSSKNHQFASPNLKLRELDEESLISTRAVMSSLVEMVEKLKWKTYVVIYDSSRAREFDLLLTLLHTLRDGVDLNMSIYGLTFETTTSFWTEINIHLQSIHGLFFPAIHFIVFCNKHNTTNLITKVISSDLEPGTPFDFRHNSFWVVMTSGSTIGHLKRLTDSLENVVLTTWKSVLKKRIVIDFTSDCKLYCDDRYAAVAYGTAKARTWRYVSYSQVKTASTSGAVSLLFPNTAQGHNQRELRVVVSESLDCLYPISTTNQTLYTGYCLDIFDDLVTVLNFSYRFIPAAMRVVGKEVNGTWTGCVGAILRGEADIIVTDTTMTAARRRVLDYISPSFQFEDIVILYQRSPRRVINIFRFLEPFSWEVYSVLVSAVIVTPLAYFVAELFITTKTTNSLPDVFAYFCGSILQQGGCLQPETWTARALTSTFWLCSICLAASYSAFLTASFTVTNYVQPFTDIRELLQRTDYKIGTNKIGSTLSLLQNATSGIHKELWGRIAKSSKEDPSVIDRNRTRQLAKVTSEKYAVIVDDRFARRAISQDCSLDYLKDSILMKQSSFAVKKGSPYKYDMDKIMSRFIDSGLLKYYKNRTLRRMINHNTTCGPVSMTSVSTEYMVGILSCLAIGFGIATLVLIVEFLLRNCSIMEY